jgi:hypothetical protein
MSSWEGAMANPEPPVPGPLGEPTLSGTGKTEEDHWKWVLRRLGGGVVDVELTSRGDTDPLTGRAFPAGETHEDDCLEETRLWYSHRVGFKKVLQVTLNNRQGAYLMPPETIEVIDVWLPSFQLPSLDADQFSFTYFSLLFGQWTNPNVAPMPYSDLVQRLQYLEEIGRIFSTDREWNFRKEVRLLEILPPPSAIGSFAGANQDVNALVTIWSRCIDTRVLDPEETRFFRTRLQIEAMRTLGNIRNKFDTLPSLGGDRSLQGDIIKGDADALEDKLNQWILNWKRATPILAL